MVTLEEIVPSWFLWMRRLSAHMFLQQHLDGFPRSFFVLEFNVSQVAFPIPDYIVPKFCYGAGFG